MKIEITRAIEESEARIKRLKKMRPVIQRLIDDAKNAESGKPSMTGKEFANLRDIVECEMIHLGLAEVVGKNENGIGGTVGIPKHWAQAELE